MFNFQLNLSNKQEQELRYRLDYAEKMGNSREIKKCLAIAALSEGQGSNDVAKILQVSKESIRQWLIGFLTKGFSSLITKPITGRPPKLTEAQCVELSEIIRQGPQAVGFPGACWRTPMVQYLIQQKFKVTFSVKYLSEFLNHMGFSYQKATFVAANRDEKKRKEWIEKQWPEILNLSNKKNAHIFFGDEASFPQWGTLNYTWAPIGEQPVVNTSGTRKSYKVFGLIDYFTGTFYSKGLEEKLNSDTYMEFLQEVLSRVRKHVILIQDGARYHTSAAMKEFFRQNKKRLTAYQLPSFSPDYNPIEMLWKKIKQAGTHLQYFPTFDSLVIKVEEMLELLGNVKEEVLSLFEFYENLCCE